MNNKGIIKEEYHNNRIRPIEYEIKNGCWLNISHTKDKNGYGVIKRNGRKQGLHRYVAALYHGQPEDPSLVVMHSCNNSSCINPDHLSYGTALQNTMDASKDGLILKGENANPAKLSNKEVADIKHMLATTDITIVDIAKKFNISKSSIKDINRGRSWVHIEPDLYPIPIRA